MKRKTAKEILAESFKELADKKSVDRITVKDIVENCDYSTATFYRHFKDKYDLIAWYHTNGTAEIMDKIGVDGYTWEQTLIEGARGFNEHKKYLANLFLHTSGMDSFVRYMTEINFNALKKHILEVSGGELLDQKTEMCIRLYCMGTVNLTCEWILGKYEVTPDERAEVYRSSLPLPLHPYLLNGAG